MHWDLRLQVGNALRSFAVPRGPSLNPEDKRLAVNTEDHPLEYLDFEAVIPEGNYGAGAMIAWDTGRVSYLEGSAEDGIARGKIDFVLSGFKLNGRFALIETGSRRAEPGRPPAPEWLLVKKQDAHSKTQGNVVEEQPRSILSGLTVEELTRRGELADEFERRAAELGAAPSDLDVSTSTPMLCALEGASLDDPERLYELKLDGVRILADKHGDGVALRYRSGRPATVSYPEIAHAMRAIAPDRLVLDGEIVAFDESGRPSFQRLAPRIHALRPKDVNRARTSVPVVYLVFDVLQIGSQSLVDVPLVERKKLLLDLVRGAGFIRALDHIERHGQALFDLCRTQHLEGVVAKRSRSKYRFGPVRTPDWVKVKCEREDDFVVMGWLPGKGGRGNLGALCVGTYAGDRLVFRGRVGSGFDASTLKSLLGRLQEHEQDEFPGSEPPPADLSKARFVRPELVVSVQFMGWTDEGRLRAPVFRGERTDVDPSSCHAMPPDEILEGAMPSNEDENEPRAIPSSSTATPRRVVLTNQDKIFWPDEGYTKGDLCEYYAAIAPYMLPFLRGRGVVLVRYPDGISGKNFYQWRAPEGTPDWLRTLELYDEEKQLARGTGKNVFLVDDVDSLLHIANLGCIPLHVLASRETTPAHCDFLTIDFDIAERPFREAIQLALTLKEILGELGLPGYPKTSGQKGLHVLVPLGPGVEFSTAKILCELLGRLVVGRHPDIATMERRVDKRGPKVYVDTGQTGRSRTIVAPYSVRAYPGATVSTPLRWEEVHLALDPSVFTMLTVVERTTEYGDPMARLLDERPDIAAAVETIGEWLSQSGAAR